MSDREQVSQAAEPDLLDVADAAPEASGVVFPAIDTANLPAVQQRAVAAPAQAAMLAPDASPQDRAMAFLAAGGNAEHLRMVLDMQKEWEEAQGKKAFFDAMARVKANPPKILKDKHVYYEAKNGQSATEYWHASLGNVCNSIIEALSDEGITHRWDSRRDGDRQVVRCTLRHVSGYDKEFVELDGPLDDSGQKNNLQRAQSTRSYLQRYTLLLVTGFAVSDELMPDDDGRLGGGPPTPRNTGADSPYNRARAAIEDQALVQKAEDASLEGWDAFRAFVNTLTPAQRTMLEPISARLKDAAKDATNSASANQPQQGSTKQ